MKKSECAYDGATDRFKDGRCKSCGRKRREAVRDARRWDKNYPQYIRAMAASR